MAAEAVPAPAPEAPTEVMPATPGPEAVDPDILAINIHNRVSDQVLADAERRGRPDLVGLTGVKDDKLFKVRACDPLFYRRPEKMSPMAHPVTKYPNIGAGESVWHTRVQLPVIDDAPKIKRAKLPTFHKGLGPRTFGRKPKGFEMETGVTPGYAVYFYDGEGRLTDLAQFNHDDFIRNFLDEEDKQHKPGDRLTTEFAWEKLPPEMPELGDSPRVIPAELSEDRGDALSQLLHQAEVMGLENGLQGLAWTRNIRVRDKVTQQHIQIVCDSPLYAPTPQGPKHMRAWWAQITEETGEFGTVVNKRELFEDYQLQKFFNDILAGPDGQIDESKVAELNLRWVVPAEKPINKESDSRELSLEDAMDIFASPDIYEEDELAERVRLIKEKQPEELEAYAEELRQAVAEHGTHQINHVASSLRDAYARTARRLEIPLNYDQTGIGWLLWDLARARYLFNHPEEATPDDAGYGLADPFGNTPQGRSKRFEIIDRYFGLAFEDKAVKVQPEVVPVKKVTGEGQPIAVARQVRQLDGKVIKSLPILIQQEIKTMLEHTVDKEDKGLLKAGARLGQRDYIHIGQLLRWSSGG